MATKKRVSKRPTKVTPTPKIGSIVDLRKMILDRIRGEVRLLDELAHVAGYDKGSGFGRYGKA